MSFLCFDGVTLSDHSLKFYEISNTKGIFRLIKPWKYYLHSTMGRPIIVSTGVWANERLYKEWLNDTSRS